MQSDRAADLDSFRAELVAWLAQHLTAEVVAAGPDGLDGDDTLEVLREWNHALFDAGWAAVSWPVSYGGRDADVDRQLCVHEEMSRAGAPGPLNSIGVANIGPAILSVGSEDQRERYLRPMLRGDEIWCQGMSEPDAGSDLASLRTAAVADGDAFVINGQKTWNSFGRHADFCQLYVRTDPEAPKHRGISCLLIDMSTPGIEVRPLKTMTGDLTFCELFFTDVRVPRSSLLGELNQGWRVAMTTLANERAGVARLHLGLQRKLDHLLEDARAAHALENPVIRDRFVRLYSQIACMRWTTTRDLSAAPRGDAPSSTLGSLAKMMWSTTEQQLAQLAVDALGQRGLLGGWATNLAASRQSSIAGGTSEINRNILAEHGLGLPR